MLITITLVLCIILFSACSPSTDEAPMEQKSRVFVDFSTFQVEVEDMSRGSDDEPLTLSDVAEHLSFAVFKSDGVTLVEGTTIHQVKSNDVNGFGRVQLQLHFGSYKIVAVAHSGTGNVNIQSVESATLPGTMFKDTFVGVYDLDVATADCSFEMPLRRITSAFYLNLTDTPPANASTMKITLNNGGATPNQLNINPSTGFAEDNWSQSRIFTMTNIIDDEPDLVYYIGKSFPTKVIVKATAYDSENKEVMHRIFTDVPLTPNKKTRAIGVFFNASGSGSFIITSDWASDDEEIPY